MKRYRVFGMDFDSTATLLAMKLGPEADPKARAMFEENDARIRSQLATQYGPWAIAGKIQNLIDLGPSPFSLIAFHNQFYRQARDAFIVGSYYPALTAASALGERVLNHLVLAFRDGFQSNGEYRKIYRKKSFDDWHVAINALVAWNILLPKAATSFRELCEIRNRSIHFNLATETNVRGEALRAMHVFSDIIKSQFASIGEPPWLMLDHGIVIVRKAFEKHPFVAKLVIPGCMYVGPNHRVVATPLNAPWQVDDSGQYSDEEISDEEYMRRVKAAQK